MSDLAAAIGSLLTVGIPEAALTSATRDVLAQLQVGGVILFKRNVGTDVDDLICLVEQLRGLPSAPLISIDHEGGRVMRVGEPFTHFPAAAEIGRTGDASLAQQVGRAMGLELASLGIDVSYAPVLDINSNPHNPVIGDRSFGSDPQLVASMAVAQMQGLQSAGVIACGKHFPGHGDTTVDSHHELPVVRRSRAQLDETELVPFRAAIAAGVPMLMSAHVVYPALEEQRPATLSPRILGDLLRGELGFAGVIASDDMDMRAIRNHQSIGEAAVAAVNAGVDTLLLCQKLADALQASTALHAAVQSGELALRRIEAAARNIADLKRRRRPQATLRCELPNPAHRELAARIKNAKTG